MSRTPNRRGMTLIELTVALVIIALAVGVAVPAFRSIGNEDDLTRATRRIHTLFRLARDSAISTGRPVTVVIDSVTQLVWIDSPDRHRLASGSIAESDRSLFDLDTPEELPLLGTLSTEALTPGSPLGLPESVTMALPRARARFQFQPSGAALADSLLLTGSFGVRSVTLDPWTGDVRITP